MELILQGKILQVFPMEQGLSKAGKEWAKQSYLLETQEQFPRKVIYSVFGEQRIADCEVQVGDVVKAYIDIESREFKGKWYTNVNAYKVELDIDDVQSAQQPSQQQAPVAQPQQPAASAEATDGDLPY